tara:strand:+ start:1628 stop:3121 length:1494 start_codon:yes stop_codon:yes gene_type:complete
MIYIWRVPYFLIFASLLHPNLINYNLELVQNVRIDEYNSSSNFGVSDVWGYTDETGIEYAIVGYRYGTFIFDVSSTPGNSILVADILGPSTGDYYFHRDYKTYGDILYIVNEMYGGDIGMQVVDLSPLPYDDPIKLDTYTNVSQSHNLWINENGFAFIEHQTGDNIHIANLSNPGNPVFESSFNNFASNCHDIYTQDEIAYVSEGFSSQFAIYDIADLNNVSSPMATIPCEGYAHNAWTNDTGNLLVTTEETANKTIKIWDISDFDNIALLGEYLGENGLAHNVHVKGHLVYISHYTTGLKIIDIFDPTTPVEVAAYDTYLDDNEGGFYGCWGAFPFTSNSYIYASDMQYGLYILNFEEVHAGWVYGQIYFNDTMPLINTSIKSVLNNKVFYTDEDGYYTIGFPEGVHEFIINEENTVLIEFLPHQTVQHNIYLNSELTLGDVNADNIIDVLDIIIIVNIIMDNVTPTTEQQWAADLNSDEIINIQDIIILVSTILN